MTDEPVDSTVSEDDDDVDSLLRAVAAAPPVPLSAAEDEGLGLGPGDRIGERYEVERLLGRGGMGEVYRAHDTELDRSVAIKLHLAETRPGGLDRLLREAQALARLSHPHVVAVFEVGTFQERLYLAMELVEGSDLRAWLRARSRRWPEIRDCFLQAGRGLAAAHAAGLVHRDFKPDNVLVGDDGRVRVADFGLVREESTLTTVPARRPAGDEAESATRTGTVAGTPAYMAPEQRRGESLDARADQFAFCMALHEAVVGERPRIVGSPMLIDPEDLQLGEPTVPGVPASVRSLLKRGLSVEPEQRFADMDALLEVLTPAPRSRRSWWVGAALAVAGAAGAAWWWMGPPPAQCDDGRQELASVWSASQRDAVRGALEGTGLGFASRTAAEVTEGIDRYADAWLEQRARACQLVTDSEASVAFDRRLACLRRRRIGLEASVDLLVQADADLVDRARDLVPSVDSLTRCEDDEALAAAVPPPDDPEVAAEVAAIRDELARWPALDAAGRYDQAVERFSPLVPRARATGYEPVLASALFIHGQALLNVGRAAEAEPLLSEAYLVAQAARDDFVAYEAAATLVRVTGRELDRQGDALRWGKHAEALLPSIEPGQRVRGMLFDAMTSIHRRRGDLVAAEASQRRAVEEARAAEDGGWEHGGTMMGLAGILTDRGRPDDARPLAERALQIMITERGPDHPAVAVAHSTLGPILEAQGDPEGALEHRRRAMEILEAAYPAGHPRLAAVINNYGHALLQLGRVDEALPHIERAVELMGTLEPGSRRHMFLVKVLASALVEAGRIDEGIARYEEVLRSEEDPVVRAQALNDLGDTLRSEGRPQQAIERFEQAIGSIVQAHGDTHPELALPRANLGYSLLAARRPGPALEQFDGAIGAQAQIAPDDPDRLYALVGKGIAELALERHEAALRTLERADLLTRSEAADPSEVGLTRLALARALRATAAANAISRAERLEKLAARAPGHAELTVELESWLPSGTP